MLLLRRCEFTVLLVGCFLIPILGGCGSSSAPGPIAPRLVGKWETRGGFAGTLTIDFGNNGIAKITDTSSKPAKEYAVKWYLFEDGKDTIKIHMQPGGKEEYQLRTIKFIDANFMEMKVGGKNLGRYTRL